MKMMMAWDPWEAVGLSGVAAPSRQVTEEADEDRPADSGQRIAQS